MKVVKRTSVNARYIMTTNEWTGLLGSVMLTGHLHLLQEAAALGKKVMVLDYVVPTPLGTSWGELFFI